MGSLAEFVRRALATVGCSVLDVSEAHGGEVKVAIAEDPRTCEPERSATKNIAAKRLREAAADGTYGHLTFEVCFALPDCSPTWWSNVVRNYECMNDYTREIARIIAYDGVLQIIALRPWKQRDAMLRRVPIATQIVQTRILHSRGAGIHPVMFDSILPTTRLQTDASFCKRLLSDVARLVGREMHSTLEVYDTVFIVRHGRAHITAAVAELFGELFFE